LIWEGVLNWAVLQGFDAAQPLEEGRIETVSVHVDNGGYLMRAGHVLRLAWSISYWPFIWPEAEAARLSLQGGVLAVPTFEGQGGSEPCDLAEPPAAPEVSRRISRPALSHEWSQEGGRHVRRRTVDNGKVVFLHNGIERSSRMTETLAIDPEDPSSARMELTWHGHMDWEGGATATVLSTRMSAEDGAFHLWGQLEAFSAGDCIFTRTFSQTVPRKFDRKSALRGGTNSKQQRGEDDG